MVVSLMVGTQGCRTYAEQCRDAAINYLDVLGSSRTHSGRRSRPFWIA